MTPREMTRDQTDAAAKPFSSRELLLHGKPNWAAAVFFACIASLHVCLAVQSIGNNFWEGLISAALGTCFLTVSLICIVARSEISICPRERRIHLHTGLGRLSTNREVPFAAVRGVRVTLWQTKRGQRSRVDILCHGEEIPCPPTPIPRQQALYLALVMKVRLIKVSDEPTPGRGAAQRAM